MEFDYDQYDGTGVKRLADLTKNWAEAELRAELSGDGGEGDGEVETVAAEIPVDILRRISPLCEKMGLTIKCYVCYVITLMLCFIYFQRFL